MKVHVWGIDHYFQNYELKEWMDECRKIEVDIKGRFYKELETAIGEEKISVIAEECKKDEKTIPRALACEQKCEFREIDMPLDVRRANGIPDDYEQRGDEEKLRGYLVREQHMFAKAVENLTADTNLLVVCGTEHMQRIADTFSQAGHEVVIRNVATESWFDPPYRRLERGEL
jgi:hypothetical protein